MKFSAFGLVALLSVTFFSCSPEEVLLRRIQGEWALTELTVSGVTTEEENGMTTETGSLTATSTTSTLILAFDNEGNYMVSGDYDLSVTASADGFSFTFEVTDANDLTEGIYTFDETTITLDPASGEAISGTCEISGDTMVISYTEVETETDGGVTTTDTSSFSMTFTRP